MKTVSKNKFKNFFKLKNKKFRQKENLIIIEGFRLIEQLIDNNIPIEHLLITKDFKAKNSKIQNYKFIKEISQIDSIQLQKLSSTKHPQAIIGIIRPQTKPLSEKKFVLYLDEIHDPGNLGTIIRTSAAAGISGIILSQNCCELFNPKVIRASMGMIFSFPIEIRDFDWLKSQDSEIIITALKNSTNIFEWEKNHKNTILVIGSEAHGISDKILEIADARVKIPLSNNVESLNAAIATGIAVFVMKFNSNIQNNKINI